MRLRIPRLFSRLGLRLMLFNCLLVFLPLAALMFLDVFESRMLDTQENTMAAQARVLASSLGASLDALGQTNQATTLRQLSSASLIRLAGRTITRLRILDTSAQILADSSGQPANPAAQTRSDTSTGYDRSELVATPGPKSGDRDAFTSLAYRLGSLPFRLWRAIVPPPAAPDESDDSLALGRNPAVLAALDGHYGSHTRVSSGQRSVTLYTAVPITLANGQRAGLVLASQSTWRTLQTIYEIRRSLFQIFLVSLVLALALSFLLSLTISRPLRRMREMAEGFIDQWGRPSGSFRAVRGSDELASLSRSLVRLGDGLADHVHFIESFAADLAHELRNPLSAIHAAAELLGGEQNTESARLTTIIRSETARIDRIVSLSRDLSKLDLAVGGSPRRLVDCGLVLEELTQTWHLRGFELILEPSYRELPADRRTVLAEAGFLRQALDKLVENALDFSPDPGSVRLSLASADGQVELRIADQGPGVRDKLQIFRRFHTERRESGHTGLGLSLAKSIVEAFGGTIAVLDRPGGGAIFAIKLPQA